MTICSEILKVSLLQMYSLVVIVFYRVTGSIRVYGMWNFIGDSVLRWF